MLYNKLELESDEVILTEVRRHWFTLVMELFFYIFAAAIPALLFLVTPFTADAVLPVSLAEIQNEIFFFYISWVLFLWMGAWNSWTNYYLDVLIVTNRRLIMIDQKGFFRRSVSSFRFERLQDVRVEVNGIIATFLDFGTIHAETAGNNEEEFRARDMPHPGELKALIVKAADDLMDTYRTRPPLGEV